MLPFKLGVVDAHQAIASLHQGIARQTLVNNINLEATLHRGKLCPFDQFANVIHPGVAGRIDFNDVQGGTIDDRPTGFAFAAGGRGGHVPIDAI